MNRIDVSLNFLWLLIAILAVRGERGCDETQLLQHRMPGGKDESQLLAAVAEAYESKRGLIISGTGTPQDIQPDHSGSVLRSDFPPMIATYIGLIFDPSKHPEVLCSFVVDGGTDHRKSNSGSLCGWAFPQFKKMSTRCDFPPEEYVQRYGLKPMADVKQYGAEAVRVWAITQASCSFTTIDDMLLAEGLFWNWVRGISKEDWDKWGQGRLGTWSGPTGFNEIVFKGTNEADWVAIYWAHTGDFIRDWSQTDKAMRKGPCCITVNQKGRWCDSPSSRTVIEIANLDYVGWGAQYDYTGLSAYAARAANSGGSNMFRILPKAELCALDCTSWDAATCDGWS
jgi:hypothetical protein